MNKFMRAGLAVAVTSLLMLSTACAQLPKSGEIKSGPNVESGLETDYLYYSPSFPVDGATQEDIVLGFLNAGTGPQNDYEVAKAFLSSTFKDEWNPNNEVLIQDGNPKVTLAADGSATVVIPVSARINNRGQYQAMPAGSKETIRLQLHKESGQWRITSAPNLITIIRPVFDVVFKAYALYFFDNQGKHLVPDVRWFPSRVSTSTRLVTALLGGPSEWLADAAKSAIPEGTKLSLSTVTVADGIATVDLSAKALLASAEQRRMLQTQIRETLIQLNSVYSVNVTVQRSALDANAWNFSNIQSQIVNPVALQEHQLMHVDSSTAVPIGGSKALLKQFPATDFAINTEEKSLLLSTKDGVYLTTLGKVIQEPKLLVKGDGYLSPILDADGYSWLIPKSGNRQILVFSPDGKLLPFSQGWLGQLDRLSFSMSNEGSRIVVAAGTKENNRVYVAAVLRDEYGNPTGFGTPIKPAGQIEARSVTWLDNIRIGILGDSQDSYSQPLVVMVGGGTRSLTSIADGQQIVGSGQAASVFVVDSTKSMYQLRSSRWVLVATNVDALHFPGN
jgi:hypothetical protein